MQILAALIAFLIPAQNSKTLDLPILVLNKGEPAAGCTVSPRWKLINGKLVALDGVITDTQGRARIRVKEGDGLIAVWHDKMGVVLGSSVQDTQTTTLDLKDTQPVTFTPRYTPPLNKGEAMPATCIISPCSRPDMPGQGSRSGRVFILGSGGIEAEVRDKFTVQLPESSYLVRVKAGKSTTITSFSTPMASADIYIHWEPKTLGRVAPELKPTRVKGPFTSLSALRGKWVYVDFWATWCGPCVAEMPSLIDFYNRNSALRSKFEILSVHSKSGSEPKFYDKAIKGLEEHYWKGQKLPFPVLFDGKGAIAASWRVGELPSAFLIDPSGRIVPGDLNTLARKIGGK